MDTKAAYNAWALQYDANLNKTRDLEGEALQQTLQNLCFKNCLEIGCGTGKNTQWLLTKAQSITAIDFSDEMLAKAKEKVNGPNVEFVLGDINEEWTFRKKLYDLVSFSLVLEHIEDLEPIFAKAAQSLTTGGYLYVGELHPFKQYSGSKARFITEKGEQIVPCFNHHLSDFIQAAHKNQLALINMEEYFDDNDRTTLPRILTILFKKL